MNNFNVKRLISVLFIGGQLVSLVSGDCTFTYSGNDVNITGSNCVTGNFLINSSSAIVDGTTIEVNTCTSQSTCSYLECTATNDTTGSCKKKSTSGYAVFKESLLNCSDGTCTDVTSPSGFYKNSDSDSTDKPLIKCATDCESIPSSDGYYINADTTDTTKILFSCSNNVCSEIGSTGGFYLNTGDPENNPVIKCSTTTCTPVPTSSVKASCAAAGDIVNSDGIKYYCPTTNNDDKIEIVTSSTPKYYFFTLASSSSDPFTGSSLVGDTSYLIKSMNKAAISMTEDNTGFYVNKETRLESTESLYNVCTPAGSIIKYSIASNSPTETECVQHCTLTETTNTYDISGSLCNSGYYLASGTDIIDSTTKTVAADCSTSGCTLLLCTASTDKITGTCTKPIIDGYAIFSVDNSLISCTTTGGCKAATTTSGFFINAGSTDTTNHSDILITCTNNECEPLATTGGYYINGGVTDATDVLIHCSSSSQCETASSTGGYYINAGDTTPTSTNPWIKCIKGDTSCSLVTAASITNSNCQTGGVAGLIMASSNVKFCPSAVTGDEIDISATTDKYYYLEIPNQSTTPFTGTAATSAVTKILVKAGNKSVTLDIDATEKKLML